jgi:hypothetical protein
MVGAVEKDEGVMQWSEGTKEDIGQSACSPAARGMSIDCFASSPSSPFSTATSSMGALFPGKSPCTVSTIGDCENSDSAESLIADVSCSSFLSSSSFFIGRYGWLFRGRLHQTVM